ncbi:ABC transporter, ATP-binding protein [Micavibrio aeruginosavorus EPB]|uniref:ABC transporter, ATP-binding protein n=1 Tax=Micavibrio aeruginosavorus EPB TaxID=349215 RepID=M4VZV1_9BACT|nr:ABC transporter, ATP-binding protein [Micavibrio aeruginosavorus EPB]
MRRLFTKVSTPDPVSGNGLGAKIRARLMASTSHTDDIAQMKTARGLISSYWKSNQKYKAFGLLAAMTALTFADIYLGMEMLKWPGAFLNALASPDFDAMALGKEVLKFVGLGIGFAGVWNYRYYLERHLIIGWRGYLTEQFGNAVLKGKSFFHINNSKTVPNMDQRLSEDPDVLASQIVELYTGGLRAFLNLVAATYTLYQITGPIATKAAGMAIAAPSPFFWTSAATALVCAAIGTVMLRKTGKPSVQLGEHYVHAQGEMRSNLTNMFSHSSEIASYNDQNVERKNLKSDFDAVKGRWISFEKMQAQIGALLGINNDMSKLVAWGVGAIGYKIGQIATTGDVLTYVNFLDRLRDSLAWPMQVSQAIFRIQTRVNLMTNFAHEIELSKDPQDFYTTHGKNANIKVEKGPDQSIILRDIKLQNSVHDEPILNINHLQIGKGERILLTGRSGSGKSLLLRSIVGLWKHGDGAVTLPSDLSLIFASQTPHIKGNITLKENVIYPSSDAASYDDDDVTEALRLAELDYLVPHLQDKERNNTSWRDLSIGEKQRLIFARIFLHKPDMVFLDEATSGLDEDLQELMYQRLREIMPDATVISIAHRSGLMRYHTRHLDIKDGTVLHRENLDKTTLSATIYRPYTPPRPPFQYAY